MIDVVVPSTRADAVERMLRALRRSWDGRVIVVWDRPCEDAPVLPGADVVRGAGRGPAAARNIGWRASDAPWIGFLDDDVIPPAGWGERLRADVAAAAPDTGALAARVEVPLPRHRRPTDWERNVAGLAGAPFVTADCACRRRALDAVDGFDERFPRAYREDTDLELRLIAAGWRVGRGERRIVHPVGEARRLVSLRLQRGNGDDVLLWALHGARSPVRWRGKAQHALVTAAGLGALAGSRAAAGAWLAATARAWWCRVAPGPRSPAEVATMAVTSAAIPPLATWHLVRGVVDHRAELRYRAGQATGITARGLDSAGRRGSAS
jgi:hypothetical protein